MGAQEAPVTQQLPGGVTVTFSMRRALTVYYDAVFRDRSGATVTMHTNDHRTPEEPNITLQLHDAHTDILTGTNLYATVSSDHQPRMAIRRTFFFLDNPLKVQCGTGLSARTERIAPDIADDLIRDRVQQFAAQHPALARAVRGITLPVDTIDGAYANFAALLDTPAHYRACAPGKPVVSLRAGK